MAELDEQLQRALAHITDEGWGSARSERNLPWVRQRLRAARRRRAAAGLAAAAGSLALGWALWREPPAAGPIALKPGASLQPVAAGPRQPVHFADGSRIELLDPAARVVLDEVSDSRVAVQLLAGRVRAHVVPRKQRAFRVQCGSVSVEVLGTAFELTREAARTHVSVLHGRVAVRWPDGSTELAAGEAGWFPKPRPESMPATPASSAEASPPASPLEAVQSASPIVASGPKRAAAARRGDASTRANPRKTAPEPPLAHDASWQAQAERGDYARAYALMATAPEPVADDVQDLLLAADAARLSGHAAAALPYLQRVVDRHAHDPRASLAAFTLGGVLLNQLDRPREAEAAYARARSLALSPALAQDALARQVEATARAGDEARTRELAAEYLRRYPDGRRVQWVRRLSGQ
jgi:transmembrane sensor